LRMFLYRRYRLNSGAAWRWTMPKVVAGYKEEARRTILQTAADVFAEKGYHDATMDDVARKLGVSKGALYQYFPSKDVLLQELCGKVAKRVEDELRRWFDGPDMMKAAEQYMKAELDAVEARQTLMFEAFAEAPRDPGLNAVIRDNHAAVRNVLVDFMDGLKETGRLRKDLDTDFAAKYLIALRHGVVTSVFQGLGRDEAIKIWLAGFELVLNGKARRG